ncbi:DUF397 domain-containing protein [Streptomyces sp. NPDC059454]|uniref:DUF397 domain-containing protein n=1 Tax=Streptomyces sp. NPDC059454 TaxID=3346836 RepID=UPI0036CE9124
MTSTSTGHDASALVWFKSSYSSSGDGNDCIEIATDPDVVRVRDSKNIGGPQLALTRRAWADFATHASGS